MLDASITNDMLGDGVCTVQGKQVKHQPDIVDIDKQTITVPPHISKHCSNVELSLDVMHVNNMPFLISLSEHLHHGAIGVIDNLCCETLNDRLKLFIRSYAIRGFRITMILVDMQCKALKDRNLIGVAFNVVSRDEHVPKIERFIRVIKERGHCYYAMMSFSYLSRTMVVHLMKNVMFYVNVFVWKKGASQVLPPLTIVEGTLLDYNFHFRIMFGEFVQTYEGTTNAIETRAIDAIALEPNGKMQCGVHCFSLVSGRGLCRAWKNVTTQKMTENTIRRINFMDKKQSSTKGLRFGYKKMTLIVCIVQEWMLHHTGMTKMT